MYAVDFEQEIFMPSENTSYFSYKTYIIGHCILQVTLRSVYPVSEYVSLK